jgi:hypothetical protein
VRTAVLGSVAVAGIASTSGIGGTTTAGSTRRVIPLARCRSGRLQAPTGGADGHRVVVVSEWPGKKLNIFSSAAMVGFFEGLAEAEAKGMATPERLAEISERNHRASWGQCGGTSQSSSPSQVQRGTSRRGCSSSSFRAWEFCMATWLPNSTCSRTAVRNGSSVGM